MGTSPLTLHAAPAAGFDQPFEMLGACHDRVRRSLALLERLAAHLAAQGADDPARSAAADVRRYFDVAAPAHHEDEERHVLPALRATGDRTLVQLAARLHEDHRRMAAAWALARPALADLAEGRPWTPAHSAEGVAAWRAFAALYVDHLEAEDATAFPAARAGLGPAAQASMGQEMAARRGVKAMPT